jgi:hypothetical protein
MIKKRRRRIIDAQTHVRIYKKDLAYFRRKNPRLTDKEIFRNLRRKC